MNPLVSQSVGELTLVDVFNATVLAQTLTNMHLVYTLMILGNDSMVKVNVVVCMWTPNQNYVSPDLKLN